MPRSGRTGWRFALPPAERKRPLFVACHTEATTSPPTAFDRAICGWPADEVPVDLAEDAILARLLELNRERAATPSTRAGVPGCVADGIAALVPRSAWLVSRHPDTGSGST
jgi:hypothetical protein